VTYGRLSGGGPAAWSRWSAGAAGPGGWRRAVLPVESLDHAHDLFLALGAEVEVLGPPKLRLRLAESVRAPGAMYRTPAAPDGR
jgi:predicted DNA-binding transcriptional regulator YafY